MATITFWQDGRLTASDGVRRYGNGTFEVVRDSFRPGRVSTPAMAYRYRTEYPEMLRKAVRRAMYAKSVITRVEGDSLYLAADGYVLECIRARSATGAPSVRR